MDDDDYEDVDGPWCKDFDGHKEQHRFCEDHQAMWCRSCSRMCAYCVDDPRCRDCGCSLLCDEHDWDCSYYGD